MPHSLSFSQYVYKKKPVAWVSERTIPIERPPLVGEVSAEGATWSAWQISMAVILVFLTGAATFYFK
jgi:hypothetical protein